MTRTEKRNIFDIHEYNILLNFIKLQPFCNEPNVTNATASPGSTYIFTERQFSCSDSKNTSTHLVCKEDLQWHGGCERKYHNSDIDTDTLFE